MNSLLSKETFFRKYGLDILAIFCFLCLSTFFYFKLNVFKVNLSGDNGSQLTNLYVNYKAFNNGEISLWYPYLWFGMPGAGHTCLQILYPVYLFLFSLKLHYFATLLACVYAIHMAVLCAGLYLFLRINNVSRRAAFVSVLITVTSAEMFRVTTWVYLYTGFAWHPLVLTFALLAVRQNWGRKLFLYILLSGFCLGMSGLACPGQSLLINILVVSMLWLCVVVYKFSKRKFVNVTLKFLCIGIIGIAFCSPALLCVIQFSKYCVRFVPDMGFVMPDEKLTINAFVKYGVGFLGLQNLFQLPIVFEEFAPGGGGYWYFEGCSMMLSLLGICGFFSNSEKSRLPLIFSKVLFAFVVCYATSFVLPYIFWYVPYFNVVREPFLYLPYMMLPLAYFAGVGLDLLLESRFSIKKLTQSVSVPIVMYVLLGIVIFSMASNYLGNGRTRNNIPIVMLLLAAMAFTIEKFDFNYAIKTLRVIAFNMLLIMAVVIQVRNSVTYLTEGKCSNNTLEVNIDEMIKNNTKIKEMVKAKSRKDECELGRFFSFGTNAWQPNTLSLVGLRDATAYMNPWLNAANILIGLDQKARSLLGDIRYVFITEDKNADGYDWFHAVVKDELNAECMGTIQSSSAYSAYGPNDKKDFSVWNVKTNGSAWCVNSIKKAPFFGKVSRIKSSEMEVLFKTNKMDYAKEAWLDENASVSIEHGENDWSVDVVSYKTNSIEYSVKSQKKSIFVTSELWYPGWDMYVDGKKTRTLQVNLCFRGCELPAGAHDVRMVYHPRPFYLGLVLLFAVLLAWTLFYLKNMKKE